MTANEQKAIAVAAKRFIELGASQVYIFGSAVTGKLRPNSDIDMAVSGLPPAFTFPQ